MIWYDMIWHDVIFLWEDVCRHCAYRTCTCTRTQPTRPSTDAAHVLRSSYSAAALLGLHPAATGGLPNAHFLLCGRQHRATPRVRRLVAPAHLASAVRALPFVDAPRPLLGSRLGRRALKRQTSFAAGRRATKGSAEARDLLVALDRERLGSLRARARNSRDPARAVQNNRDFGRAPPEDLGDQAQLGEAEHVLDVLFSRDAGEGVRRDQEGFGR